MRSFIIILIKLVFFYPFSFFRVPFYPSKWHSRIYKSKSPNPSMNINRKWKSFWTQLKLFDTVNHSILVKKLELYEIRGLPLSWFRSYLDNRRQQVLCHGTISQINCFCKKFHKSSILKPLLLLLYI